MSLIIKQIVDLIVSFLKDFLRNLKLKELDYGLKTMEQKTDELIKKTNFDYDAFQRDLIQFEEQRAANMRPVTEEVRSPSAPTAGDAEERGERAPTSKRVDKRAAKSNQRSRKRK